MSAGRVDLEVKIKRDVQEVADLFRVHGVLVTKNIIFLTKGRFNFTTILIKYIILCLFIINYQHRQIPQHTT